MYNCQQETRRCCLRFVFTMLTLFKFGYSKSHPIGTAKPLHKTTRKTLWVRFDPNITVSPVGFAEPQQGMLGPRIRFLIRCKRELKSEL